MLARPRRAHVRARTYGGDIVDAKLDILATADGLVYVQQPRDGQAPWNAWIPVAAVTA